MEEQALFDGILLLEDDTSHALIIKRALTAHGAEIKHASTLAEALTILNGWQPDLIISDLHLPDAVGVKDLGVLIERDVPLIVLTSSTSWSDAVAAMKAGAKDFIVKDFGTEFSESIGLALSRVYASTKLMEERQKLLREMETLRITIENSSDGLAVVGVDGEIRYSNRSFKNFALKCGAVGENISDLFSEKVSKHKELTESIKSHLTTLEANAVWHREVLFCDDAAAYDLSLAAVSDTATGGWVVWIRDITENKRREKFQREMLSTTTHDLKGPLGAISLSAEILEDLTEKGSKVNEIALRIGSSAQGMINLINEFLSTRRLQEGNFIMKPADTSLKEAIDNVSANYMTIAAAKGVTFNLCDCGDERVFLDRVGFERVLGNLLNNAFKFTPRGGSVTLSYGECDDGGIRVDVSDTGSGMEPSEVTQIFQRFTRLERHNSVAGSGLGLSVVKSIVTAHGGNIEVTSKLGQGTTMRVTFPKNPPVNEHGELIALDFV